MHACNPDCCVLTVELCATAALGARKDYTDKGTALSSFSCQLQFVCPVYSVVADFVFVSEDSSSPLSGLQCCCQVYLCVRGQYFSLWQLLTNHCGCCADIIDFLCNVECVEGR